MVNIKGIEFKRIAVRDSYNRRALQYKNKIINELRGIGLTEDDVDIPLEQIAIKKAQAQASWWMCDEHLFFSYNGSLKFVDNLAMVAAVIHHFIQLFVDEKITQEELIALFAEESDIIEQRKHARTVLGVKEDSIDFDAMHKKFKSLSKEHHPDMPNGSTERFKEINRAHKILRKELCP